MSESTQKKAAESRAAASQSNDSAPTNRQSPDAGQQTAAATSPTGDDDKVTAMAERAEAAADRAEEAFAKVETALAEFKELLENLPKAGAVETVSEKPGKAAEIGSPAWQKANRLDALQEEIGFAKAKGQTARVKEIQAEIKRIEG